MLFATAIFLGLLSLVHGDCVYKTVAFSASIRAEKTVAADQVLVYDYVITNYAKAYDYTTGTFTAPTEGLYGFHFHTLTARDKEAFLKLYHNANYIISVYGKHKDGYGSSGNSVVLRLHEGDTVYIKAQRNSTVYGVYSDVYTSFSGHLISVTAP